MSIGRGACDPLADARAEMLELLASMGVSSPDAVLNPIFDRLRLCWAGQCYIKQTDSESRDRIIREGLAAGLPAKAIARKAGVHPSTVWRRKDWAI